MQTFIHHLQKICQNWLKQEKQWENSLVSGLKRIRSTLEYFTNMCTCIRKYEMIEADNDEITVVYLLLFVSDTK